MYVHLGGAVVVAVRDVVAILDGRAVAESEINQEFVRRARQVRRIHVNEPAAGKSWVVATDAVYPSGISAATLARRMTRFQEQAAGCEAKTQGRTRGLGV